MLVCDLKLKRNETSAFAIIRAWLNISGDTNECKSLEKKVLRWRVGAQFTTNRQNCPFVLHDNVGDDDDDDDVDDVKDDEVDLAQQVLTVFPQSIPVLLTNQSVRLS